MNGDSFIAGAIVKPSRAVLLMSAFLVGCGEGSSYEYPSGIGAGNEVVEGEITVLEVAEELAESACALYADCNALQGYGGGESGCQDAVVEYYVDLEETGQCDLDVRAAESCMDELDTMSCDDLESEWSRHSACYQVCGNVPVWAIL